MRNSSIMPTYRAVHQFLPLLWKELIKEVREVKRNRETKVIRDTISGMNFYHSLGTIYTNEIFRAERGECNVCRELA